MRAIWIALLLCFSGISFAQVSPTPATILSGSGSPVTNGLPCGIGQASSTSTLLYNDYSITAGNSVWKCAWNGSTFAWNPPFQSPVLAVATSSLITGGTFLLQTCTANTTVTVPGAVVGTNSASANPIFVSAPSGSMGLFNLTANVTAANTVTVQGCAFGTIVGTVPNFYAKVLLY